MEYRSIKVAELTRELFDFFERYQPVEKCFRKINGAWCIKDISFIDDWNETEYEEVIACLTNSVKTGGMVYGAFEENQLKGFASIESAPIGSRGQYLDLSMLYVSKELRGYGIGKNLFVRSTEQAKKQGAKKLYISAHSAVETQAFYQSMGCVKAEEYDKEHVHKEPCDCQMEYEIKQTVRIDRDRI